MAARTTPTEQLTLSGEAALSPLVPVTPVLPKQTYSARLSYVGVTRRTIAWHKRVGSRSALAAWLSGIGGFLFLLLMYVIVTAWYLLVYGVFGIFTWVFLFPFRLIRRSQRKTQALQAAQLATMQAMLVNQQRALAEK